MSRITRSRRSAEVPIHDGADGPQGKEESFSVYDSTRAKKGLENLLAWQSGLVRESAYQAVGDKIPAIVLHDLTEKKAAMQEQKVPKADSAENVIEELQPVEEAPLATSKEKAGIATIGKPKKPGGHQSHAKSDKKKRNSSKGKHDDDYVRIYWKTSKKAHWKTFRITEEERQRVYEQLLELQRKQKEGESKKNNRKGKVQRKLPITKESTDDDADDGDDTYYNIYGFGWKDLDDKDQLLDI